MELDTKTYSSDKMKVEDHKPGDRLDGKVVGLKEAPLREHIEEAETRAKFRASDESIFLKVSCEFSNGYTRDELLSMPPSNEKGEFVVSPKSKFGQWKNYFDGFPEVGQPVFMLYRSEDGFQFPWK